MINQSHFIATSGSGDASLVQPKSLIDLSFTPVIESGDDVDVERDLVLTHKEARAGSPDDIAACGEEDIGSGLEFLVTREDHIQ